MAFIKQIKVGNNTYDIHKKVTVTIAAADWTAATIDKTVSGMTVNDIVVVSPAPSSIIGARNSVVYCSAIKANALSFTYSVSKPTAALTFNVLWVQAATTDTNKGAIINTVMGGKIPTGTLNVNSTLSNYDTYLNNVRYINLGAGTIDVADKTVTPNALAGTWDATNEKYVVSQAKKTGETMQSTVTTAGYVSSTVGTKNTGALTINAPANLEIAKATITNNTSGGTSPVTINRGKQIKIGAGYNPTDLYYIAQDAPTLSGNAAAGDVLSDKTFYSNSYTKHTGTMTNRGAVNPTALNPGGSYTILAGYHNGNGKVTARALNNQAKSPTEITVGTAITPDSGRDGLSSVTIPSNATITVASNNTLNITVPANGSSVVNYDSTFNEIGINTQLNATVGGDTLNTIDVIDGATANVNVYNMSVLNINRVSGTVHSDDLVASNIRSGASILGVVGTYVAGSTTSDVYKAQYAGNVSSGWSTYWSSYEENMGSNWSFTEPLSTPIPQGVSVRLRYNEFGPNASSSAGFRVFLVSAGGTAQLIANPSAYEATSGPHTSSSITSNFVATKIRVEKFSATDETVSTYQALAVEVYVNVPSGYYGVTAASGGSVLADVSSYQYMAVKKATLGNTYKPSTWTQSVKVSGEGWVKTSDTVATIKAISTETKTVTLSLASGNQTVNATDGKYMTSVTINKPSTLVAYNIKSGVNIAGVTGTYEGGSSTSAFSIYIRDENGALLHTLNIRQIEWGIKWGEYIAVCEGHISWGGGDYSITVGGEIPDPATSNNDIFDEMHGWYLYSGSGNRKIGITGLMVMGPGDYYLC